MADALIADAGLHSVLVAAAAAPAAAAAAPAAAVEAGVGAGDDGDSVADGAKVAQPAESKQNALSTFTILISLKRPSILHVFDQCLISDHAFGVLVHSTASTALNLYKTTL